VGRLVDGVWSADPARGADGRFVRKETSFRDWVRADGSTRFAPRAGRYHLYVSLACPWAHRVLIVRALKGLRDAIPVSVVDPFMGDHGWSFSDGPDCIPDPIFGAKHLHEIYVRARPDYTGRATVPVLWDRECETIVSNESSEIIRMLDAEFAPVSAHEPTLYPEAHRLEIDEINESVFANVNNGVYRCGFATTQAAYDDAFRDLFSTLDALEARLSSRQTLIGDGLTEADWRLFPTLIRFDPVYHGHFKCNLHRIADYRHLDAYMRRLYAVPGVAETVNLSHIRQHYYQSHTSINPSGIVPGGPALDW
jgi:putative glutathione S-transferase